MKKLINRFLGVVVAAALLVGTAMPNVAVMADVHSHGGDTCINESSKTTKNDNFIITLKHPVADNKFTEEKSHYGAYQIFSGTVKNIDQNEPGKSNVGIPITDIKWGNAFGESFNDDTKKNILAFVYALSAAPTGEYKYAFSDFNGFEDFFVGENLNSAYTTDVITVTSSGDVSGDLTKVNFDKLAVAVADVLANKTNDHEWLQAFNDILGGYANGTSGYKNKAYAKCFYEGYVGDNEIEKSPSDVYTIYVPAGYYMIRDMSEIDNEKDDDRDESYSARMLFVTNNVTQTLKEAVPKLDKEILRDAADVGTDGKETDVAGVGDVVHFQLEGTLPSNYDLYLGGYQYTFIDTLSKGLDLSKKDGTLCANGSADGFVTVTAKGLFKKEGTGGWTWDPDAKQTIPMAYSDYTSDVGEELHKHHLTNNVPGDGESNNNFDPLYDDTKRELTVKFTCLKEIIIKDDVASNTYYRLGYNTATGAEMSSEIYVDYYAKVNKDAVVSSKDGGEFNGNYNNAQIKYSDNPQAYSDTDYTTIERATVYTFGVDIVKVDAAEFLRTGTETGTAALDNAEFALVRPVKDASGNITGWEIAKVQKITPPITDDTLPSKFITYGYYSIVQWDKLDTGADDVKTFNPAWLDNTENAGLKTDYRIISSGGGILNVSGLDVDVTYTMVETATPDNTYAKIAPFDITLKPAMDREEYTGTLESATVTKTVDDGESFSYTEYVQLIDPNGTDHVDDNGSANMFVANFKYVDLPSTGGIGIYPFYIIGGIVVAGSIILFALSRRKKTA